MISQGGISSKSRRVATKTTKRIALLLVVALSILLGSLPVEAPYHTTTTTTAGYGTTTTTTPGTTTTTATTTTTTSTTLQPPSYSIEFTASPSSPIVGQPVSSRFVFKEAGKSAAHIYYTYSISIDGTVIFTSGRGDPTINLGNSLHTHTGDSSNVDPDRVAPFTFTETGTYQVTVTIVGFDVPERELNPPLVQQFQLTVTTTATTTTAAPTTTAPPTTAPPVVAAPGIDPLLIGGVAAVLVIAAVAAIILRRK